MRGELLVLLSDGIVILCLARFLFQAAEVNGHHPLAVFSIRATDWLVRPLRRIMPARGRWDFACVAAGLLLYYAVFTAIVWLAQPAGFGGKTILANLLLAALGVCKSAAYVLLIGLALRMISSLRDPYSATAALMQRIFMPILQPFAFLRIGRYDFSGSLLALVLWIWLSRILPQLVGRINLWLLQ